MGLKNVKTAKRTKNAFYYYSTGTFTGHNGYKNCHEHWTNSISKCYGYWPIYTAS